MNCRECRDATAAWLEGLLDEQAKAAFEAHVSECEECRTEADGAVRVHASLRGRREAVGSVRERVMTTISRRAIRPRGIDVIRRHMRGFATAAAAAAVVLAGMFWWVTAGTRAPMSAWASVTEAAERTKGAEWVHFTQGSDEVWISFSPRRSGMKRPDSITYSDAGARTTYTYSFATNTITVSGVSGELDDLDEFGGAASLFDAFMAELDELREKGAAMEKTSQTVDGKAYDFYTHEEGSVTVDPSLRRIVRFEGRGRVVDMDYPSEGPRDIYALGAPRDARVINWGYEEAKALQDNLDAARAALAREYFAITLMQREQESKEPAKFPNRSFVTVEYKKGGRRRVETYAEDTKTLMSQADCGDAASLEAWTRGHELSSIKFYDGRDYKPGTPNETDIYFKPDGTRSKNTYECPPFLFLAMNTVEWVTWGHRATLISIRNVGRGVLPLSAKAGSEGLLEGIEQTDTAQNEDGTPAMSRCGWYFNPLRDFAAEERVLVWFGSRPSRARADDLDLPAGFTVEPADGYETVHVWKVTEYAQTPAGKWYAKKAIGEAAVPNWRVKETYTVFLDTLREIPDDLFEVTEFEAEYKAQAK